MTELRTRAAAPSAVARAPRGAAAPRPPEPAHDLAVAARAAGADVHSGPDFMEISFPPPAGAAPATIARTPAPAAAAQGPAHAPANVARQLSGAGGGVLARAVSGGSSGSGAAGDSVVSAVLRALREENEHLGILDGIDPLF